MFKSCLRLAGAHRRRRSAFARCRRAAASAAADLDQRRAESAVRRRAQDPTSFAFGDGAMFEGDAGNSMSRPPNGGVYVLPRRGAAIRELAALRRRHGVARRHPVPQRRRPRPAAQLADPRLERLERHDVRQAARSSTPRRRSSRASTASPSGPTAGCTSASTSACSTATTTARRTLRPTCTTSCR